MQPRPAARSRRRSEVRPRQAKNSSSRSERAAFCQRDAQAGRAQQQRRGDGEQDAADDRAGDAVALQEARRAG